MEQNPYMETKRLVAILGLGLLVVLAGCGGLGDADLEDAPDAVPDDAAPDDTADALDADADAPADATRQTSYRASDDANGEADGDADAPAGDRDLIRTGEVDLVVEDVPNASAAIRETTADRGGFVSDRSREVDEVNDETWRTETIVVRVPSESFEEAMADVEQVGDLRAQETETEDVTDQLVDLEARLANLEAERDRLRDLYEEANETEDVLAVQRELSSVQEEIERLEAQRQALERDVAYSTITVHLAEERPEPAITEEPAWYETSVVAAFLDSVSGVAVTLRAIVVGLAYVAPYAVVFGTPVLGAAAAYRYRFD